MNDWVVGWFEDLDKMLIGITEITYRAIVTDLGEAIIALAVLAVVAWMFAAVFHLGDQATLQVLAKIAVLPGLLFAFSTEWDFFAVTVYALITNGTSDLIATVTDDLPVWEQLGRFVAGVAAQGDDVFARGGWGAGITWWILAAVLSVSLMIMAGTAVAILSAAKLGTALLLGLAPLFIISTLFAATRPLFSRWVGHILGFSLTAVLITLAVKAMLIMAYRQLLGLTSLSADQLSFDPISAMLWTLFVSWLAFLAAPFVAVGIAGGYGLTIRHGVAGALLTAGGLAKNLLKHGPTPSQALSRLTRQTRAIRQR